MKFNFLILSAFLVLNISACSWIITMDDVYEKQGFLVSKKGYKTDCDVKFVRSLPSDSTNYQLLGTCISEKSAKYGNKNMALKRVHKCACHNEGDFAKIIKVIEYSKTIYITLGGIPDFLNPNSPKYVEKDFVMAEIYRKIN